MNRKNWINQVHSIIYKHDIENKGDLIKSLFIMILCIGLFVIQIIFLKNFIINTINEINLLDF